MALRPETTCLDHYIETYTVIASKYIGESSVAENEINLPTLKEKDLLKGVNYRLVEKVEELDSRLSSQEQFQESY